jgi:hypothetical protein
MFCFLKTAGFPQEVRAMLCSNQIQQSVINANAGNQISVLVADVVARPAAPAMRPYSGKRLADLAATGRRDTDFGGSTAVETWREHCVGVKRRPMPTVETSKRCSSKRHSTFTPQVAELPAAAWAALALRRALSL